MKAGVLVAAEQLFFPEDDQAFENLEEDTDSVPFKYSITSYGADYPVDGLVKRIGRDTIFVPDFQRGYVWTLTQASRFVESLLLGLPVPGIFLSRESETEKLLVIDGQQRLKSLLFFYEGIFEPTSTPFRLAKTAHFEGATYDSLEEEDRRRLDDAIIHATIVKQDEPSEDQSSIYHIFERLNTGGTTLYPQEIRACIYHGEFNAALGKLNLVPAWRTVYGDISPRMRDQELLLRFFALFFAGDTYDKPMKGFLNRYMASNRHLTQQDEYALAQAFVPTIELVERSLGKRAFRPRKTLNAAVFDAVMVGLAHRLSRRAEPPAEKVVQARYDQLLASEEFAEATARQTSNETKVSARVGLAIAAFADA